jgi:hypothetical protein
MTAEKKTVTIALPANLTKALTWVLQEAVDISVERIPGLSIEDATDEVRDLSALVDLLQEVGGDPKEVAAIAKDVTAVTADIESRSAPALG